MDYIAKPFEPEILHSKVEVFVELWRRGERIRLQEEALRKSEREAQERRAEHRLRDLIDAMPLLLWAASPEGALAHANRAFDAGFQRHLAKPFDPADLPALMAELAPGALRACGGM